jgi:hypothetical protein
MRVNARPVGALIAALRGLPPGVADWFPVVETANRSWLTPALFVALRDAGRLADLPDETREYLAFIHDRNRQRNLLLQSQLVEAVGALNRAGIQPVLLKGAGILFSTPDEALGARMMSDLDLLVEEAERPAADAVLASLGYHNAAGQHGVWRPQDAGVLELHGTGGGGLYGPSILAAAQFAVISHGAARARLPSPTFRALHLILHDQIKEGDYWRGSIDLRHLHDLAGLAAQPGGVDWAHLDAILTGRLRRNAFETQLLTLRELFGTPIPESIGRRLMPRAQHWRRMVQLRHPRLAAPLRLAGAMAWLGRRIGTDDRPRFTVLDFAPRAIRKLRQGRRRAAEALMGVHLGPKL